LPTTVSEVVPTSPTPVLFDRRCFGLFDLFRQESFAIRLLATLTIS